jgi:hypothetical protein
MKKNIIHITTIDFEHACGLNKVIKLYNTQRVKITRTSVKITRMSLKITLVRVKITLVRVV